MEKFEQLEKLGKLKEQGLLSEQEFENEKKKILGDTNPEPKTIPTENIPLKTKPIFSSKKKNMVIGIVGGGIFVLIGIIFFANYSKNAQHAQALQIAQQIEENAQQKEYARERRRQDAQIGAVNYLEKNTIAIQSYLQEKASSAARAKYPKFKHIATETFRFEKDVESKFPSLKGTYVVKLDDVGFFSDTHYTIPVKVICQIVYDENNPTYEPDYRIEMQ